MGPPAALLFTAPQGRLRRDVGITYWVCTIEAQPLLCQSLTTGTWKLMWRYRRQYAERGRSEALTWTLVGETAFQVAWCWNWASNFKKVQSFFSCGYYLLANVVVHHKITLFQPKRHYRLCGKFPNRFYVFITHSRQVIRTCKYRAVYLALITAFFIRYLQ